MAVHISEDRESGVKILYCSTTMKPFGDVYSIDDDIEDFLEFLGKDARLFTDSELNSKYYEWLDI